MNNFDMMQKRLEFRGGVRQEDRMIQDKWKSMHDALKYSYQACTVQKIDSDKEARALINPDKVKQDYDDKIISIDYSEGYVPGDVFEWKKTGTHWIIYLEEITEDAYFRGEIRRCRYVIKFKNKEGKICETWAAIRGPVETTITSIQKNQIRVDQPNLSLNILMPQNEDTLYAFERYKEFLFCGRAWKVEAHDSISMRGILEVNAREDYINKDTDDVDNEIKDGLKIEPVVPTPVSLILGETFIKPKIEEIYTAPGEGTWGVKDNAPVTICPIDFNKATVIWNKATSGQFVITWTDGSSFSEKTVVVESLF